MKALPQFLLIATLCLITPFFANAEYGQSAAEMEAQAAARNALSASEVKAPNLTSTPKKETKATAKTAATKAATAEQTGQKPAAPAGSNTSSQAAADAPTAANAAAQENHPDTPAAPASEGSNAPTGATPVPQSPAGASPQTPADATSAESNDAPTGATSAADSAATAAQAAIDATAGELVSIGEGAEGESAAGEGTSTQSDPLMNLILAAVAAYLFYLWLQDYRARQSGNPNPNAFPGAVPTNAKAVTVAVIGALVILAAETGGEIALGISSQQSTMTVLMLLSITAAAFFEELIFRGYLVVSNRGRTLLIGSIIGFSVIFALAHPFLWEMTTQEGVPGWQFWNADWSFNFTTKGWFSTAFVLLNSLWFYAMRFNPLNPQRSLIPCMAAHLATNWGVFAVKLAQGHVSGLF